VLTAGLATAATTVTVDPAKINLGFMNVFNLPSDGGAFQFASGWGFADLTAVYSGSDLTLGPNHINDPNPYWYIGGGGPGAPGNKIMEANSYAEETGTISGTLNFEGLVLSNTLTSSHTVTAFIKDFAPDYSSNVSTYVTLPASGHFIVSQALINDPARHVQWGFQMVGPCVWVTDLAQFGSVTVSPYQPVPAQPATWGRLKGMYR
jgi:hypothetical protein